MSVIAGTATWCRSIQTLCSQAGNRASDERDPADAAHRCELADIGAPLPVAAEAARELDGQRSGALHGRRLPRQGIEEQLMQRNAVVLKCEPAGERLGVRSPRRLGRKLVELLDIPLVEAEVQL
jgi:hypothetical protein